MCAAEKGQFPDNIDGTIETIDTSSKVIIVSTRVPEQDKPMSGGMAPQVRASCTHFNQAAWYGLNNAGSVNNQVASHPEQNANEGRQVVEYVKDGITIRRIELDEDLWNGHYNAWSNAFIWPLNHDFPNFVTEQSFSDVGSVYAANDALAHEIAKDLALDQDQDTPIWVHDYHHMTLPHQLRQKGVTNPITFFNHTPLPSLDTLDAIGEPGKTLFTAYARELLHCDAVLLQSGEAVNRFLAISGLAPVDTKPFERVKIQLPNGQNTTVGNFPISINVPDIEKKAIPAPIISKEGKELEDSFQAENIFIDIARADYSKGLVEKAEAFAQLMQQRPDLRGKAQLVIGAEPTRTDIPAYQEYAARVKELTEEINCDHDLWVNGKPPVVVLPLQLPHEDVIQLLRNDRDEQRKIGTIACWRDGMNLVCKEFLMAQDTKNAGVLVLSDQTGAGQEHGFSEHAITYTPDLNDRQNLINAMIKAIEMPQDEANTRAEKAQNYLRTHSLEVWAKQNVKVMKERAANNNGTETKARPIYDSPNGTAWKLNGP
jgi:trehalose 6-phosphate synthase